MNPENPYDAVLEDNVTGYGEDAATDRVTEYGILVAQATGGKKSEKGKKQPKLKTATKLFITDPTNKDWQDYSDAYIKYVLKGAEKRNVNSWDELSTVLDEYQSIDQLVLYFHAAGGATTIGGVYKDLDQVSNLFPTPNPKIKQIDFEGCNVGEAPDKIVPFARIFSASTVKAWTYFHGSKLISFNAPQKDEDLDAFRIALRNKYYRYIGHFLPGTPTADEISNKAAAYNLGIEWFTLAPEPDFVESDPRGRFKRRTDAKPHRISSDKAEGLRKEYEAKRPNVPFEQVIIDISAATTGQ